MILYAVIHFRELRVREEKCEFIDSFLIIIKSAFSGNDEQRINE